jgi:hypothetical protein
VPQLVIGTGGDTLSVVGTELNSLLKPVDRKQFFESGGWINFPEILGAGGTHFLLMFTHARGPVSAVYRSCV